MMASEHDEETKKEEEQQKNAETIILGKDDDKIENKKNEDEEVNENVVDKETDRAPTETVFKDRDESENKNEVEDVEVNENVVDVGFLVDKISTKPYHTAIGRGEVPFCAFAPISSEDMFLLRIQDCSDVTRHMLVPANKEEVFNTPGALKEVDEIPDRDDVLRYKVAIVAIARQVYCEEQKQLFVSVDPLLKKDRSKFTCVKFLSLDKFADYAFAGFDGNVSDFAKKSRSEDRSASTKQDPHHNDERDSTFQPPVPSEKMSAQQTARRGRGRGGRRGVGRGRRSSHSTSRDSPMNRRGGHRGRGRASNHAGDHQHFQQQQNQAQMIQQVMFQPAYQPVSAYIQNDCTQFIKMEGIDQRQLELQFFSEVSIPMSEQMTQLPFDQMQFSNGNEIVGDFFDVPVTMSSDVPMPCREVTLGQNGGTETNVISEPQSNQNQDVLTISLDELLSLTGDHPADSALFQSYDPGAVKKSEFQPERAATAGSRGGRRPGRKPGRKSSNPGGENVRQPMKDSNCAFGIMATDIGVKTVKTDKPKRRGRPPKNKVVEVVVKATGQENENPSSIDCEEFERMKLEVFGDRSNEATEHIFYP